MSKAAVHGLVDDVRMEVVQLVEEGDTVAARFVCSATHLAPWRGHAPTGRCFRVDSGPSPSRAVSH